MALKYYEQIDRDNTKKLRELLDELPYFCTMYFRGIETTTSSRTRIAYARDLKIFFQFLIHENPLYKDYSPRDFQLEDLDQLTVTDLEDYLEYIKYRTDVSEDRHGNKIEKEVINSRTSIKRKVASIRTFYRYLYRDRLIKTNPADLLQMPKLKEKDIIRLDANEVADLLDEVENGEKLTRQQQVFHDKTELRDEAHARYRHPCIGVRGPQYERRRLQQRWHSHPS